MRQFFAICLFFPALLATISAADTIILQDGSSVTGTVLADKETQLVVDIGVTVLILPKDKIVEWRANAQEPNAAATADVNEPPAQQASDATLYHTGTVGQTSIEDCVQRFSEAVVLVSSPAGLGSGFFINENGYLITNYHVIERETRLEVTVFIKGKNSFEKKKFSRVKIEALNPFVDLALLKVEDLDGMKTTFVYLGDMDDVKVGEAVFAIGNPLGLERTTTSGIISTKSRAFEGLVYIQTNTDINPGNSGGPLFNIAGEVVGVTNMGYIFFGGLGFAIPVDYVKHFIENREAFAYDKDNPNAGYRYIQPARRLKKEKPDLKNVR
ncbi:MAG: trypsin-like peptidase domain-containing protein [Sedimentisphaerales bacterium]|nr:trypsin-like peptidase domain-containing protein [Sedimentisphaerales bacterium]